MNHNNGNFTVEATDGNGCVGTSASLAVTTLGITNLYDQASVKVVPNPATDIFTLSVNQELVGTSYMVTDMMGREIISGNINAQSTLVSVSGMSAGIYLVTVTDGTSAITKRIAVTK
jgi:hypothetical protein